MMDAVHSAHAPQSLSRQSARVILWYTVEGITSIGTTLLSLGIFFYMRERFGWGLVRNFSLAAAQGMIYTVGALLANPLQARLGRQRLLTILYLIMAALAAAALFTDSSLIVAAILLAYVATAAMSWPALESLLASGVDAHRLSKRMGIYNLLWAGSGAFTIAINGALIEHWRAGVFLLPVLVHATSCLLMVLSQLQMPATDSTATHGPSHLEVEAPLLRQRQLALWLSRISLPSTYVVIYSLMAMLPSLPAI